MSDNTVATTDHDPCQNGQPFSERHADEHRREDFAKGAGIAANGHDAPRGSDADADSRATEGQTDVNITCQFCEHMFLFLVFSFKQPFAERSPGRKLFNF